MVWTERCLPRNSAQLKGPHGRYRHFDEEYVQPSRKRGNERASNGRLMNIDEAASTARRSYQEIVSFRHCF